MDVTRIEAFERSARSSGKWLEDLDLELGWNDPGRLFAAWRVAVHVLRDRLAADEAVQLGAQMPALLRGFYYEGWSHPSSKPKKLHRDDFEQAVRAVFPNDMQLRPDEVLRAVFKVLKRHIDAGEIADVLLALPKDLRELWPA